MLLLIIQPALSPPHVIDPAPTLNPIINPKIKKGIMMIGTSVAPAPLFPLLGF